jgi:hypothetical protein
MQPGDVPTQMMSPGRGGKIIIGPNDSMTITKRIRGKLKININPPGNQYASIEVFAGDKQIKIINTQPYDFDFDSATLSDGEQILKAVAKNSSGKEVWKCSSKVEVANSRQLLKRPQYTGRPGMPNRPGASPQPGISNNVPGMPNPPEMPNSPGAANYEARPQPNTTANLERTYANDEYCFSIQYPNDWTFMDKTAAMKPKSKDGCWLAFGVYPLEKSKMVVNVRRTKLEPATDADKFAKYNTYVQKWERKAVLDTQAFATVSKIASPKKIVHRLIIVKDGFAWMLNCEDQSGKPMDESATLFRSMVNSLKLMGGSGTIVNQINGTVSPAPVDVPPLPPPGEEAPPPPL